MSHRWVVVFLLLVHFFLRVHHLTLQDPYVDEGFHIIRAATAWDFEMNPGRFAHGKVLLYFWLGIFEADPQVSLFMARAGMVIFSLITAAAVYQIGKRLGDHTVGSLALALYALFPLAFFYERMAMADPFAAGFACLVAWRSLVFAKNPCWQEGVVLGGLLALTTLAKLTMGLLPLLPLIATFFYFPVWNLSQLRCWIRRYVPPLVIAACMVVGAWLPLLIPAYLAQASDQPFVLVSAYNIEAPRQERQQLNAYAQEVMPLIADYTSNEFWGLSVFLVGVGLLRRQAEVFFLLAWMLLMVVLTVAASKLTSSRYFMPISAPLVLLVAYSIASLRELLAQGSRIQRNLRHGLMIAPAVWVLLFAAPFFYEALYSPFSPPLKGTNSNEYLSGWLTGDNAIREAANTLNTLEPKLIYANWSVCELLYFYANQPIQCLKRDGWEQELREYMNAQMDEDSAAYLVLAGYDALSDELMELTSDEIAWYERAATNRPVRLVRLKRPAKQP